MRAVSVAGPGCRRSMCCLEMDGYQYCGEGVLLYPIHIADQSKYPLQPLKDPLVAVAAADYGVFIPTH